MTFIFLVLFISNVIVFTSFVHINLSPIALLVVNVPVRNVFYYKQQKSQLWLKETGVYFLHVTQRPKVSSCGCWLSSLVMVEDVSLLPLVALFSKGTQSAPAPRQHLTGRKEGEVVMLYQESKKLLRRRGPLLLARTVSHHHLRVPRAVQGPRGMRMRLGQPRSSVFLPG